LDPAYFKKVLIDVIVPEFSPKAGVKIQVQENEAANPVTSGIFFKS
jgi:ubiquitin-activating enzyme E1